MTDDKREVAAHLVITLAQSPEQVRAMRAAASRDTSERFTLERRVWNHLQLYQEVIEEGTDAEGRKRGGVGCTLRERAMIYLTQKIIGGLCIYEKQLIKSRQILVAD